MLVADADIEATMEVLLTQRQAALGIRDIAFTIIPHLHRDPGCRREAARTASRYANDHEFGGLSLWLTKILQTAISRHVFYQTTIY